jgi:hypothetical protein
MTVELLRAPRRRRADHALFVRRKQRASFESLATRETLVMRKGEI